MSNNTDVNSAIDSRVDQRVDDRLDQRGGRPAAPPAAPRVSTCVDITSNDKIDHEGDLAAEILAYLDNQDTVDHLFRLPRGAFRWDTEAELNDFDFFGLEGSAGTVLEVTDDDVDIAFNLGQQRGGADRVLLRNFELDISGDDDRDAGFARVNVDERALLEDLRLRGQRYRRGPNGGDRFTFFVNMTSSGGFGTIRNVRLPDGDRETSGEESGVGHAIPFSADPPHEGTNIFKGCYVEGFVDNGYYVSNSPGRSILRGCVAKNNGGGNIRLGRGDVARDCRIILDNGSDLEYPGCGLWLNGGAPVAEGIIIDAPDAGNEGIRINDRAEGGTLRDIELNYNGTRRAMRISGAGSRAVRLDGVAIRDDSSGDFSVYVHRPFVMARALDILARARNGVHCRGGGIRLSESWISAEGSETLTYGNDEVSVVGSVLDGESV